MTDPLLEAVDALTQGEAMNVAKQNDAGKWKKHKVIRPSLLEKMAAAVVPSGNRDSGSSATAATRTPVDLEALFAYRKMVTAIQSWCVIEKVAPERPENPPVDLRRWYSARLARVTDDSFYIRKLQGWAVTIRDKVDPPQRFLLSGACPICGKREWGDMINGGGSRAIEVRYRKDEVTGLMTDESAVCHACSPVTIWDGHASVMELAEELEERHARN